MKRSKDRFDLPKPGEKYGISGLRFFDGEDLDFQDRMKHQAQEQKEWLEDFKRQQRLKEQREKEEEDAYSEQTKAVTRMRGLLEDEMNQKRAEQNRRIAEENLRMAQAKKDKEKAQRDHDQFQNSQEIWRDR